MWAAAILSVGSVVWADIQDIEHPANVNVLLPQVCLVTNDFEINAYLREVLAPENVIVVGATAKHKHRSIFECGVHFLHVDTDGRTALDSARGDDSPTMLGLMLAPTKPQGPAIMADEPPPCPHQQFLPGVAPLLIKASERSKPMRTSMSSLEPIGWQ